VVTKEDAEEKYREVINQFDMKKAEGLSKKFQDAGFDIDELVKEDLDFIDNISAKTDNTFELKEISKDSKKFGSRLNDANLDSFEKVENMYRVGFYTGVALIASAIGIFIYNTITGTTGDSGNILSGIFGVLGVADMLLLLYTPVRELQKSRGNVSKLSALYNEWLYISSWTGKTYNLLHQKLEKSQGLEPKEEKLLNEMRWLIDLKSDTTIKLAKLMAEVSTHTKTNNLKVTITSKPEAAEVNSKIELEADVYGISTLEVDKITYLWSEESDKITIDNKDKRKAEFKHDKAGEFTIKINVKSGAKHGSATSKIVIKPKISVKAEPAKIKKDKEVKLVAKVEGLDDQEMKKLAYKWEEMGTSGLIIADDDKAEAKATPTKEGELKFKVTITKEQKEFAKKEVNVEVTS